MKDTFQVKIGALTRNLPIIKLPSKIKIVLFNSISDVEIVVEAAKELAKKINNEVEVLLTPEAKSIPLAFELARITKLPYVVARKSKKPYMGEALEAEVISITTGVPQKLYIDEKDLSVLEGKKVALVDDVVSTGATVEALKKLVAKAGGQVAQIVAVFTEGDQEKWQDATRLGHLPIFK
ncbi:MAG: phosphoribosyltransferase family protein [Patescibacteria group bacterium]|nr:phosphoribosyltransferase family protein [Patescibacteria group bacterium]